MGACVRRAVLRLHLAERDGYIGRLPPRPGRGIARRRMALLLLFAWIVCQPHEAVRADDPLDKDPPAIPAFKLTERSGRPVTGGDLRGKVWIASFVFTRCNGPCPNVTATMARLQTELADEPDLRLVTFTVDPDHDDPGELTRYAARFGRRSRARLFLTGKEDEIYDLLRKVSWWLSSRTGERPGSRAAR